MPLVHDKSGGFPAGTAGAGAVWRAEVRKSVDSLRMRLTRFTSLIMKSTQASMKIATKTSAIFGQRNGGVGGGVGGGMGWDQRIAVLACGSLER